jgi:hypothetical protein
VIRSDGYSERRRSFGYSRAEVAFFVSLSITSGRRDHTVRGEPEYCALFDAIASSRKRDVERERERVRARRISNKFWFLSCQAQRGFAQERPEDSSTSNWGAGEPPIDEKNTERGVAPGSQESQHLQQRQQQQSGSSISNNHSNLSTDSEGQTNTPNLSEEKTTRDFINIQREARTHVSEVPTYTNKDSFLPLCSRPF